MPVFVLTDKKRFYMEQEYSVFLMVPAFIRRLSILSDFIRNARRIWMKCIEMKIHVPAGKGRRSSTIMIFAVCYFLGEAIYLRRICLKLNKCYEKDKNGRSFTMITHDKLFLFFSSRESSFLLLFCNDICYSATRSFHT